MVNPSELKKVVAFLEANGWKHSLDDNRRVNMDKTVIVRRYCTHCGDEITNYFDKYRPDITECQCCIFNTEIIEVHEDEA